MTKLQSQILLLFCLLYFLSTRLVDCQKGRDYKNIDREQNDPQMDYYRFLYKRMKEDAMRHLSKRRQNVVPTYYTIPGPFEPLPGRSHNADYWPLFPFSSQYSGGLDLDPSTARHIGGDMNIPIPSWGIMDIYGRFYNRIQDTTAKFGYQAAPVNMIGLTKSDFIRLMSDPSAHYNRAAQPLIPIGKVPRTMVPMSCRAPLCNPYVHNYALGIEYDFGGSNGVEGDLDIPIPISKDVAYRFPFSGNIYYHMDNLTVTYGQEFGNVDPYYSLFEYQKHLPWLYPEESVRRRRSNEGGSHSNFLQSEKQKGVISTDNNSRKLWKRSIQSPPNTNQFRKVFNIRKTKPKTGDELTQQKLQNYYRNYFSNALPPYNLHYIYNPFAMLLLPFQDS